MEFNLRTMHAEHRGRGGGRRQAKTRTSESNAVFVPGNASRATDAACAPQHAHLPRRGRKPQDDFRRLLAVAAREPGESDTERDSEDDNSDDSHGGDYDFDGDGGDPEGKDDPPDEDEEDPALLSREMMRVCHRLYSLVLSRTISIRSLTTMLEVINNDGSDVPLSEQGREEWPRNGPHLMRLVRAAYTHDLPIELSAPGSDVKIYFRDTPRLARKMLMSAAWCESVKSPETLLRELPLLTIWGALHSDQYAFVLCGPSMEDDLAPVTPGTFLRDDIPDSACMSRATEKLACMS